MSVITAILSGLPILGKLFDRLFPDNKDERLQMRSVIWESKEFKWFLRIGLGIAVLEVLLKAAGWIWPQAGLPESIVEGLEYFKLMVLIFTGIGS